VRTVACIRVSTDAWDIESQKNVIREYARAEKITIDEFIELDIPAKRGIDKEQATRILQSLNQGDIFIASELSRLGRSTAQVIMIVNGLVEKKVRFIAVKQQIDIKGEQDSSSRIIASMFSLFAQLERDLISERTRHGLEARRAAGVKLGRPKGSTGKSRLDPHKEQVAFMLKHKAPLSYIARVYGVTWPTVANFIKTRKLDQPNKSP
jgi:DNA invertase Pin-like site-specific DNA recombinase